MVSRTVVKIDIVFRQIFLLEIERQFVANLCTLSAARLVWLMTYSRMALLETKATSSFAGRITEHARRFGNTA